MVSVLAAFEPPTPSTIDTGSLSAVLGMHGPPLELPRPPSSKQGLYTGGRQHNSLVEVPLLFRQMSEPPKIAQAGTQDAVAEDLLFRQLSEPIKISMTSCGVATTAPKQQQQQQNTKRIPGEEFAPEMEDWDADTVSALQSDSSRRSSSFFDSACGTPQGLPSPLLLPTVKERSSNKLLEPRWVGIEGTKKSPGMVLKQGPKSVIIYGLPSDYTENILMEEIKDAGFAKGRDFKGLYFAQQSEVGFCVMNFVSVGVTRSFLAAFGGGRPLRHGVGSFHVLPVPEAQQAKKRVSAPAMAASLSRSAGG